MRAIRRQFLEPSSSYYSLYPNPPGHSPDSTTNPSSSSNPPPPPTFTPPQTNTWFYFKLFLAIFSYSYTAPTFFDKFSELRLPLSIILGDFNIPRNLAAFVYFFGILNLYNLTQHVTFSTHIHRNILVLVIFHFLSSTYPLFYQLIYCHIWPLPHGLLFFISLSLMLLLFLVPPFAIDALPP